MTTITHGPDGQTRFDGMTVGEIATSLDHTSAVSDQGDRLLAAAAAALRHLSDRVAEKHRQLCDRCQHHQADYLAKWPDRAPFNGSTEFYCHGCYEEYEAGAQEVDAHEAGLAAQGIHSGYCVRPELIPLPPGPMEATP